MKYLLCLTLLIILLFGLPGFASRPSVVVIHHEMKEDGGRAIVTIGIQTALSLEMTVSGVLAHPNTLHIPANTSQLVQITILGETRNGSITFTNQENGIIVPFKIWRECSMDAEALADCAKALAEMASCVISNDIAVQTSCAGCGALTSATILLADGVAVCTVGSAGVCSVTLPVLVPFTLASGGFCLLCAQNLARVTLECANSSLALRACSHCSKCSSNLSHPPSPPSGLDILQ
jgi:hypothetical protein